MLSKYSNQEDAYDDGWDAAYWEGVEAGLRAAATLTNDVVAWFAFGMYCREAGGAAWVQDDLMELIEND